MSKALISISPIINFVLYLKIFSSQSLKVMKAKYKFHLILIGLACILSSASLDLHAQTTNIPDPNFEQALIDLGIDSDGIVNSQVLTSDIDTISSLIIRYKGINNLKGIEDFDVLEKLDVSGNNLNILKTAGNSQLKNLICNANPIDSIDISQNVLLENLEIQTVHWLKRINLSNNIHLKTLKLSDCWIKSLDVSNNSNLKTLEAGGSGLSQIDLSNNLLLEYLDVAGVHLDTLDVSNNIQLKELYCGNWGGDWGQEIKALDLSNNINLELLYAENMFYLNSLNLKNGNNLILQVLLGCEAEAYPCKLIDLTCVQVDDEAAATNGYFPYNIWGIDADFIYSENCVLGLPLVDKETFSLVQNPVKDDLVLKTSGDLGNCNIQIYNMDGKFLFEKNTVFGEQETLDVSRLSSGLYFVHLKSENGNIEVKKFIKE